MTIRNWWNSNKIGVGALAAVAIVHRERRDKGVRQGRC